MIVRKNIYFLIYLSLMGPITSMIAMENPSLDAPFTPTSESAKSMSEGQVRKLRSWGFTDEDINDIHKGINIDNPLAIASKALESPSEAFMLFISGSLVGGWGPSEADVLLLMPLLHGAGANVNAYLRGSTLLGLLIHLRFPRAIRLLLSPQFSEFFLNQAPDLGNPDNGYYNTNTYVDLEKVLENTRTLKKDKDYEILEMLLATPRIKARYNEFEPLRDLLQSNAQKNERIAQILLRLGYQPSVSAPSTQQPLGSLEEVSPIGASNSPIFGIPLIPVNIIEQEIARFKDSPPPPPQSPSGPRKPFDWINAGTTGALLAIIGYLLLADNKKILTPLELYQALEKFLKEHKIAQAHILALKHQVLFKEFTDQQRMNLLSTINTTRGQITQAHVEAAESLPIVRQI
jgi:hypothetical protein